MRTGGHWKDILDVLMDEIDLVLQVLDARNPLGTFNTVIEEFIEENDLEMNVVLILNKIDMIPRKLVDDWYKFFTERGYTMFSTTAKYNGGIQKLKKFLVDSCTEGQDWVTNALIVGYPNTGKSSLIEILSKQKKKVGISSKAGFTRSLMKVKITDNVFLFDTPGVIPFGETNEVEMALKSCMMADKVEDPFSVVEAIFNLLPQTKFEKRYGFSLSENSNIEELVEKIGRKHGYLKKGGKINKDLAMKKLIRDWQSNNLKYFFTPPSDNGSQTKGKHYLLNQNPSQVYKKSVKQKSSNKKKKNKRKSKMGDGMIPPSLDLRDN